MAGLSLLMTANARVHSMWKEVNPRLPKDKRIDIWSRSESSEVIRMHAEMYPESPLRRQMWILTISGFAVLFGGFIASAFMAH